MSLQDSTVSAERGWPWSVKLLIVVVGLFVFIVGGLFVLGRASTARWQRYAAKLQADGDPLTYRQIERRRTIVPDERNSARIIEGFMDDLEAMSDVPVVGSVFVFAKRSSGADFFTGILRSGIEPSRVFCEQQRPLLKKLTALRDFPTGRLEIDYAGAKNVFEILLPILTSMRAAAKLAHLDGMLKLIDQDLNGAAETAQLQFALAGMLNEYPTILGRIMQIVMEALAVQTIENTLRVGQLRDANLALLIESIDLHLANGTMEWVLWGERAFFVAVCDELISGKLSLTDIMIGTNDDSAADISSLFPDLLIRKNQIRGVEILTRLVDAADDPIALTKAVKQINAEVRALPVTQIIVRSILPSLSRAVALQHRITARLRSAKAILAAERFRLDTGRLPKSLEELVPTYLEALPIDPFTGAPLRFAFSDEGIVIYSIGEDLVDDGGLVARRKKRPQFLDVGVRLHKPEHRGLLLIDDPPDEED